MKQFLRRLVVTLFLVGIPSLRAEPNAPNGRYSLDEGWRFHLGDIPMPEIKGHDPTYYNAKAGKAWGAAAADYDDSQWRRLDLPHDWVVEGPFDPKANISQGYRPRGIAWYRRNFQLDETDRYKYLELQFDGIATHATVWVNGLLVHRNWCPIRLFKSIFPRLPSSGLPSTPS
jgi:beta-galactosidase